MRETLYLAWRYLLFHRVKSLVLVTSVTLILFLPAGLSVLVDQSAQELTARAAATPLLVGARGSPLELVLSSLYFDTDPPAATTRAAARAIRESGLATPIPLYLRFRVRSQPIVGTSVDYLDYRRLELAEGRRFAVAGECVLGARAAAALGVGVGDGVVSSPENVFDVAGVYPLEMRVVGVLAPSFTADDEAVLVDLKTAWIIAGIGHGHQDLAAPAAATAVLARDEATITANASVVQYNEITADNIDSFHFHGDLDDHPLTAVIAVPNDDRSGVILLGRHQDPAAAVQMVRPEVVMAELLDTVLTVKSFVVAAVVLVGLGTLLTAALVFVLSYRLRRREFATILKIGGARGRVVGLVALEVIVVLAASALLATVLTTLTSAFGQETIRRILLS